MSRYRDYEDQDEYRLPEGFERVGYDADTQTYTYRAPDGTTHSGASGNQYGRLVPASSLTDAEHQELVRDNREAWRYMLPFFLIVIVFLFCVIAPPWKKNFGWSTPFTCDEGSFVHTISSGETCWKIAEMYSTSVDQLESLNLKLNCDTLQVGGQLCVPKLKGRSSI